MLLGFSGGAFGGGSDIGASEGQPRFGDISDRTDLDVALYWSLRNLGVGNKALIDAARRAAAYIGAAGIGRARHGARRSGDRVRAGAGLASPGEMARAGGSLRRTGGKRRSDSRARATGAADRAARQRAASDRGPPDYLNAIIDYNRAEVRLYVAIGNPPADMLARPVPDPLLHPPDQTLSARDADQRARGRFAGSRHGRSGVAKGVCELCHGGMVRALARRRAGPANGRPPAAARPDVAGGRAGRTAPLNAGPGDPPSFADSLPSEGSGPLSSADAEASLKQFLGANVAPVDLMTAFRLVGEQNPQVLIAQSRVIEALALRQLAAVQFLPTLNAGTSLNSHRGTLQQSTGSILQVNRDSLYLGAGAFAVGGGSVNIPGVVLTGNVAVMTYDYLVARQEVDAAGSWKAPSHRTRSWTRPPGISSCSAPRSCRKWPSKRAMTPAKWHGSRPTTARRAKDGRPTPTAPPPSFTAARPW